MQIKHFQSSKTERKNCNKGKNKTEITTMHVHNNAEEPELNPVRVTPLFARRRQFTRSCPQTYEAKYSSE